ncbi:hypothetical protein WQ54_12075 [Bacillus sp. SA1-12]|uniref:DUF3888 domain-containing protein n=1 Tax=Bacillus sp. SA1-12 TaxID=1455638 RepID=UPI000625F7F5|nr:DUF3888 domain-containing protein [Bacillus sp. SA1-12]KKI91864.1 hypothetical protein WQ54_12075 [Bacillus sp. SA1-12]
MRNYAKCLILCIVALLSFNMITIANAEVSKVGKIKKETYATTEDVLLNLMEPKLNKIITEKYGKEMSWYVDNVTKVELIVDHTKNPTDVWYDMKFAVRVHNPDKKGHEPLLDIIEVRVDIPNLLTEDRYKETESTLTLKLIDYIQIR